MRRIFILLTMAVAAITACTKASSDLEEERINPESATYTYTITANNGMPEVKTNYDSDGSFKWSDGDAISVLFHNSDAEVKNKFFTLTLVSGANTNTATFSGEIENGYTIGASDGTEADKKIWALFPASDNHSYTEGSNPSFYVQPFVDFTATHFSANIPMYALNQEEGALNFSNLTCTYKFTLTGIKTGVTKVQCTVSNAAGLRDLSGSSEIKDDGYGHVYINYNWTRSGLTFISNVTNNQAIFYIPCRFYAEFQPTVTITNYDTGVDIKTFTANKAQQPDDMTSVKPITLDLSNGEYFTPKIFINGDFSDWTAINEYPGSPRANGSSNSRISAWKMTSDALNIYVYLKLNTEKINNSGYIYVGFDTDKNTSTGTTRGNIPGCEQYAVIFPAVASSSPVEFIKGADPRSTFNGSHDGTLKVWSVADSDPTYTNVELSIPISKLEPASTSINIGVSYQEYDSVAQTITLE